MWYGASVKSYFYAKRDNSVILIFFLSLPRQFRRLRCDDPLSLLDGKIDQNRLCMYLFSILF